MGPLLHFHEDRQGLDAGPVVLNTDQHLRIWDLNLDQCRKWSLLELPEHWELLGYEPFLTHYTLDPTLGYDSALLALGGGCGLKVLAN